MLCDIFSCTMSNRIFDRPYSCDECCYGVTILAAVIVEFIEV